MKHTQILISAAAIGLLVACNGAADRIKPEDERKSLNQMVATGEVAEMSFEETKHDFGEINEGVVAEHSFEFTNTGEVPLVITNATGSCGCTVPDWPRKPIAPGAKGEIKVSFNSNGRPGTNNKTVTLEANTVPRSTVLTITSTVLPKTK